MCFINDSCPNISKMRYVNDETKMKSFEKCRILTKTVFFQNKFDPLISKKWSQRMISPKMKKKKETNLKTYEKNSILKTNSGCYFWKGLVSAAELVRGSVSYDECPFFNFKKPRLPFSNMSTSRSEFGNRWLCNLGRTW